jgi:hypothetical protein
MSHTLFRLSFFSQGEKSQEVESSFASIMDFATFKLSLFLAWLDRTSVRIGQRSLPVFVCYVLSRYGACCPTDWERLE